MTSISSARPCACLFRHLAGGKRILASRLTRGRLALGTPAACCHRASTPPGPPKTLAGWATCPCHPTSKAWLSLGPLSAATRSHRRSWLRNASQDTLLQRIPAVPHLQSAWLILLLCGAPRATYLLRILPPCHTHAFAREHDAAVLRCLGRLLSAEEPLELDALQRRRAQLRLARGGMGLRPAERGRSAAYWASRADTLPMIQERHPVVAGNLALSLAAGGQRA